MRTEPSTKATKQAETGFRMARTLCNGGWWTSDIRLARWSPSRSAPAFPGALPTAIWSGSVAVPLPATNVTLLADDGQGHTGSSTLFSVSALGSPTIFPDLQPTTFAIIGGTVTFSVGEIGAAPITNVWLFNGSTPLVNGGRVSGATTSTLQIGNAQSSDAGTYQLFATNGIGAGNSSPATLIVENEPLFNTNGLGWTANNSGGGLPGIAANVLTLTDGNYGEARSFFFNTPMYIHAFKASFTYQATEGLSGATLADGVTFCIQNSPQGANACGTGGGELAYATITPSAAIALDLFNTRGWGFFTNGTINPPPFTPTAPLDTGSGNPIAVNINYDGNVLALTLTDSVASTSYSTNITVGHLWNIVGGDTAYIGFTGATRWCQLRSNDQRLHVHADTGADGDSERRQCGYQLADWNRWLHAAELAEFRLAELEDEWYCCSVFDSGLTISTGGAGAGGQPILSVGTYSVSHPKTVMHRPCRTGLIRP